MFIFIAAAGFFHELCRTTPVATMAGIKGKKASRFDWTPVINAIIEVESEGNAKAVDKSGKSCGCMNGGINFTKRGTQKYYRKVMSKMKLKNTTI